MNTSAGNPVYISEPPDWLGDVAVTRTFQTAVFRARNGTEQRQGRILASKISLSYQTGNKRPQDAFAREILVAAQQLQNPVVVPVWPYGIVPSSQAGDILTFLPLDGYPFRQGGEAFVIGPTVASFFPIAAMDDTHLTLTGVPLLQYNALVIPCIRGSIKSGTSTQKFRHTDGVETIEVDEL